MTTPAQHAPDGSAPDQVAIDVRTEVGPGGGYVVIIDAGPGRARQLNPSAATRYAAGVLAAAARAEHDACVAQQLHALLRQQKDERESLAMVGATIAAIRADRPPLKSGDTFPIKLEPGVNRTLEPFIAVALAGQDQQTGQLTVEGARDHALHVLEAVTAADLDSAYYRQLRAVVGLDEQTARAAVAALAGIRTDVAETQES